MAKLRLHWPEFLLPSLWHIEATVEAADEVPAKIPKNGVVLVGSIKHLKWIVFDCPCGTGHRIMANLDPASYPYWKLSDNNNLTVRPSFDFADDGHHCHFIISQGHVIWVRKRRKPFF
jgi:hypothetical protein